MRSQSAKRAIDIVGAVIGLVLGAVPMAATAVAVRLTMGSPVLFRQQRPGLGGQPFTLVKFRTMKVGTGEDADRLTATGRFLRSTSLDELPELWNVLRGEMSLVGPRPLLMDYLPLYSPEQARRHEMRPGLTGLAQIEGRNLAGWEERLANDVHYVDTWSVPGDLQIMFRTLAAVVTRRDVAGEGTPTAAHFKGPES